MKTTNARALVLVIGFCATIAVILYGVHGAKQYIDNEIAAQKPDSPKVAEILGAFTGTASTIEAIREDVTCHSGALARETALAGLEGTASEFERLVKQSRELLATDRSLTGKDRMLLAEKTAMAASATTTLRGAAAGLRACSGGATNTL